MLENNTLSIAHQCIYTNFTNAESYISKHVLTSYPSTRELHVPSVYVIICVCVRTFIHACVFCMCTLQVWISGCEGTGCTHYCSSTLISVAVLVLAVQ